MTTISAYTALAEHTVPVGDLNSLTRRGRLTSTFRYDPDYLEARTAYALEPALPLHMGPTATTGALPRSFQDCAPDRWGRNLIAKRAAAEARDSGRTPLALTDLDFLMGVSDLTRQGALRFNYSRGDPFEHPGTAVPQLVQLPRLMRAAEAASAHDAPLDAVKELLDAGTGSLGGARPKASIQDDGRLLIAKFGHGSDDWDVMRWEKTALDLASRAGISVADAELVDIAGCAVLLVERFDRDYTASGVARVGYISALTLLEANDGDTRDYLDIADALSTVSVGAASDLVELWRRAAFSVAIHNTDDHLRNHGFLRARTGWVLAPAFDINPEPGPAARRTTIAGAVDPESEAAALIECAELFGLTKSQADKILRDVIAATTSWEQAARRNGLTDQEIRRFAPAMTRGVSALQAAADAA